MARAVALHRRGIRMEPETILRRAEFLDPGERALVKEVVGRGLRTREVSRLCGTGRRQVERRLRRVLDRLTDRNTPRILRRCEHWDPVQRQVALTVFVRGRSLRKAAAELDLSITEVRNHVGALRTLLAGMEAEEAMRERGSANAEVGSSELPTSHFSLPTSQVSP